MARDTEPPTVPWLPAATTRNNAALHRLVMDFRTTVWYIHFSNSGSGHLMEVLDLVTLTPLMGRTRGRQEVAIGLIDGPNHQGPSWLWRPEHSRATWGNRGWLFSVKQRCMPARYVCSGMLLAKRSSTAPAICLGCSLVVRPIFSEMLSGNGSLPSATPQELATAIIEVIHAGVRVINLSAAIVRPSSKGERDLQAALVLHSGHKYNRIRRTVVMAATISM
jgi:hypothetical protein